MSFSKFVQSPGYKKVMGYVYGWGAAVVLLGALFKIQHYQGAGVMLLIGMGAEVFIFFLSAFEPPHEEVDWAIVYPELAGLEPKEPRAVATAGGGLEAMLSGDNKIDPAVFEKLNSSLQNLTTTADNIGDISKSAISTDKFMNNMAKASESLDVFSNSYKDSAENISNSINSLSESYSNTASNLNNFTNDVMKSNTEFGKNISDMNNNLNSLNSLYEIQIKSANTHMDSTKQIYSGLENVAEELKDTVNSTKEYREQAQNLNKNLKALNTIYGNMLSAMDVNVN